MRRSCASVTCVFSKVNIIFIGIISKHGEALLYELLAFYNIGRKLQIFTGLVDIKLALPVPKSCKLCSKLTLKTSERC